MEPALDWDRRPPGLAGIPTSKPLFDLPLLLCEMGKCGSLERPSAREEGMTEP